MALAAALILVYGVIACRQGVPIIDTTTTRIGGGTISGTVRGPEGTSPVEGRLVEVVNVTTGERQQTTTNSAGGFTSTVWPGRYRVQITLRDGEAIVRQPGILHINPSDVGTHADFIVGTMRVHRPRFAAPALDTGLAPPIA